MTTEGEILWMTKISDSGARERVIDTPNRWLCNQQGWNLIKEWAIRTSIRLNDKQGRLLKYIELKGS